MQERRQARVFQSPFARMAARLGTQPPPQQIPELLQRLLPILTPHQAELVRYMMQDPQGFAQEHNIYPPGSPQAPGQLKQPGESARAYAPGQLKPDGQSARAFAPGQQGRTVPPTDATRPAKAPNPQDGTQMGAGDSEAGFAVLDRALHPPVQAADKTPRQPSDRYFDQ